MNAAKALMDTGARVEEAQPDGVGVASQLWCEILGADGGVGLRGLLSAIGTHQFHSLLQRFLDIAGNCAMSTDALLALVARWDELRTRMLGFLSKHDVIICPVAASPAIPHATSYDRLDIFTYTMAYNFTGWPGAVVRCGTSPEGLPINVQIVAQPWREDVALAVAKHLEEVFGGW